MSDPWIGATQFSKVVQNDPILVFLQTACHFGPLTIGYLSALIAWVLLPLWCYLDGSLRSADLQAKIRKNYDLDAIPDELLTRDLGTGGIGLLSASNVYLFFLPFLNVAIFSYYEQVAFSVKAFLANRVHAGQFNAAYAEVFQPLGAWGAGLAVAVCYLIGAIVFICFVTPPDWIRRLHFGSLADAFSGQWKMRVPGRATEQPVTDWLRQDGHLRPIGYFFSFSVHFLQVAIVLNWLVRHAIIAFRVVPQMIAHYPIAVDIAHIPSDGLLGFRPIEALTTSTFTVLVLVVATVFAWIAGQRPFRRTWWQAILEPGPLAAITGGLILIPLAIVSVMEPAHRAMLEIWNDLMIELDALPAAAPWLATRHELMGIAPWPLSTLGIFDMVVRAASSFAATVVLPELLSSAWKRAKAAAAKDMAPGA